MKTLKDLRHQFFLFRKGIRVRMTRPLYKHSFYRSLDFRKWYWRELVTQKGVEDELFPEFAKLSSRAIADSAGVECVPLIDGPISIEELALTQYGEEFVIKPDWGASSVGVLVLSRRGADSYYEYISKETLTGDQIKSRLRKILAPGRRGNPDRLVVEESLVRDSLRPREWKLFTFYGVVGLIQGMGRDGRDLRIKLFSPDGQDVGTLRGDHEFDPDITAPRDLEGLVDAAKRISLAVPTGFVRVDFFELYEGTFLLGELSLIPGGDLFFRNGWDEKLGRLWDEGNVRLLAEGKSLIP